MDIETALNLINTCGLKNNLGRYNSRALNENWFIKNNLTALYDIIISHTNCINERSFSARLWAFEHLPIPLCHCGNPVKKYDNEQKWSNYCGSKCSLHSAERHKLISKTKLDSDHTQANIKRKQTMLDKYGVETNSQRECVKTHMSQLASKRQVNSHTLTLLDNYDWLASEYQIKKRSASDIADQLGIDYSTVLRRIANYQWSVRQVYNKSLCENQIKQYVQLLGFNVSSPTNLLTGKQEIDIYVDQLKFAIEVDGLRHHSFNTFETKQQKNKHLNKTLIAQQNGIDLIHITDWQWKHKNDIVKSIIKNKLGKTSNRVFARKCQVIPIDYNTANSFLNQNHLQGQCTSSIKLGLYHDNVLIAVATFGRPRYNKKYDWELIRFASKIDYTIVGGFSKLLKYFTRLHRGTIISYADRMISNGNVYRQNNFKLIGHSEPSFLWTDGSKIISRSKATRKNLIKLSIYDPNKSQAENMFANKWRRFWNSGQLVFVLD